MLYTLVCLDAAGYACRMYYFYADNYDHAAKRATTKFRKDSRDTITCGFLLQRAEPALVKQFSSKREIRFYEISTHLYAPTHLRIQDDIPKTS
jgi:hypothetical protein